MKELKAYLPRSFTTFCPKLFMNTRRKYGEEYELATIFSFQRFEKSRCVLAAKRESLVHEHGKGNKPQTAQPTIDENEEEALFEAGEFCDSNPFAPQRTVWWSLFLHFGFWVRDESHKLCCGDVQLHEQSDGLEIFAWLAEQGIKSPHGQKTSTPKSIPA